MEIYFWSIASKESFIMRKRIVFRRGLTFIEFDFKIFLCSRGLVWWSWRVACHAKGSVRSGCQSILLNCLLSTYNLVNRFNITPWRIKWWLSVACWLHVYGKVGRNSVLIVLRSPRNIWISTLSWLNLLMVISYILW